MPRYRRIPTDVRNEQDLRRALTEMGLRNVELHAQGASLDDWIGRATDVRAHVIVRRKDLGAAADDMGFARNDQGTFDLIVSDMHLFRFDKRWIAELAQRTNTNVRSGGASIFTASVAGKAPLLFPSKSASPPRTDGGGASRAPARSPSPPPPAATPTARTSASAPKAATTASTEATPRPSTPVETSWVDSGAAARARAEASSLVQDLAKSQKLGGLGCALYFAPVVLWIMASDVTGGVRNAGALVVVMVPWTVVYVIALTVALSIRFSRRMAAFRARMPAGSELRAEALEHLRRMAGQKKDFASQQAQRALKELESKLEAALKPRPPAPPRGPGPRSS